MDQDEILSERIELMFFDPAKSHDEYLKYLQKVRPAEHNAVYSPLYLLRNEIHELCVNKQWFPAILLGHIAIEGIAHYFFRDDNKQFYRDFMKLSEEEQLAHRLYRNAREHNFGQLLNHLDKSWQTKIYDIFVSKRSDVDKDISADMKVAFQLSEGFPEVAKVVYRNLLQGKVGSYYRIEFALNPKSFLEALDQGCELLKRKIILDSTLQTKLMNDLTEDNWMRVSYR